MKALVLLVHAEALPHGFVDLFAVFEVLLPVEGRRHEVCERNSLTGLLHSQAQSSDVFGPPRAAGLAEEPVGLVDAVLAHLGDQLEGLATCESLEVAHQVSVKRLLGIYDTEAKGYIEARLRIDRGRVLPIS